MSRIIAVILVLLHPCFALAQGLTGLARVDGAVEVREGWFSGAEITVGLTQGVPFRAYTLQDPPRLIVDFQEVDWTDVDLGAVDEASFSTGVRAGAVGTGLSRLVVDLNAPYVLEAADTVLDATLGTALVTMRLGKADAVKFAATSGQPETVVTTPAPVAAPLEEDRFIVVLDPGHGGVDPGAQRGGVDEKDLMLTFARELKDQLQRQGDIFAVLTRQDDSFVSLERRVSIAHQLGADAFISLHADALEEGRARGATVHVLARDASDRATAKLAERHNSADLLSGEDLTGQEDSLAAVLLDLARQETQPRTDNLAAQVLEGLKAAQVPVNSRPLRHGSFSVLKSADVPSILVEIGFLSDQRDFDNLMDADWRARAAQSLAEAIVAWQAQDQARKGLVRH